MGLSSNSHLATALFGKTRFGVLRLFFTNPSETFYLREVMRAVGTGPGAVQREVALLHGLGLLERRVKGRLVLYRADPGCPVFRELQSLVHGLDDRAGNEADVAASADTAAVWSRLPWAAPG